MTKRPFSATSLLLSVLCLTAWNAIRLYASITDWDTLAEFAPRPGPIYIAATAAFWTLSGLALFNFLRRPNVLAWLLAPVYFLGYAAWWWLDRLLLKQPGPNQPFAIGLTIFLLIVTALYIFDKNTISYFRQRETHEQTHTDRDPA